MTIIEAKSIIKDYISKGGDSKNVDVGVFGIGLFTTAELVKEAMDKNQKVVFENSDIKLDDVTYKFTS